MAKEKRKRGRPRNFNDKSEQNTNQSLNRAIDVLEVLASESGLTLSEISEYLDQSPATIYRTLFTLEKRRITDLDTENQTWHVGPNLFRLGISFLYRSSLIERARPILHRLVRSTGETANIGIESEGQVLFLSQVETQANIRAYFPPGTHAPLHASGIGKAILSRLDRNRIEKLLPSSKLEQFTMKTIIEKERLLEECHRINRRGWALDDEEKTYGMRCIAAPILDHLGEIIGGISISGPSDRFPDKKLTSLGTSVSNAAEELSRQLGALSR